MLRNLDDQVRKALSAAEKAFRTFPAKAISTPTRSMPASYAERHWTISVATLLPKVLFGILPQPTQQRGQSYDRDRD